MSGDAHEMLRLRRLEEACHWLLRLHDPLRSDDDVSAWLRWIDAEPSNLAEFERLQRDWADLEALKSLSSLQGVEPLGAAAQLDELSLSVEQKSALLVQEEAFAAKRPAVSRMRQLRYWALAASVAIIAVSLWWKRDAISERAPAQKVAATQANRAAILPDGSKMILGVESRVNMDFNGPTRQLDLSSGEAYFKVKHDASRPFVVKVGEVSVTALGTAFDVRRDPDHVTVTIEEGIVEVRGDGVNGSPASWRAEAGYQVNYSRRERTASVARVDSNAQLAWRSGELSYVREPLGAVVEDLNRHSSQRIVIEDAQVAALPFTGTAFTASVRDWAAGIALAYPVDVRETPSGDIILRSRK